MGFYDSHNSDKNYSEKRDFIRMKLSAPLTAQLTANGEHFKGLCTDLSGNGMQVEAAVALPLGTTLEVLLQSDHGHSPSLRAIAKVARAENHHGRYLLGLEITKLLE